MIGLRQRNPGWHSIVPSAAAPVGHELGGATRVLFVEVWPHHSAPPATAPAESTREDPVQAHCSCVQVCTGQHRRISPISWSVRPISRLGDAFDLLPPIAECPSYTTRLSTVQPLVIGSFLLLLPVGLLGTVCPNMSRPHHLCLFSEVAPRLFSSGVPSHDFNRNFRSAYTQWHCCHFRTL